MTCHARHSRHQKKINVKQLSKMLEDLIKNVYHVSKLERINVLDSESFNTLYLLFLILMTKSGMHKIGK